MPGCSIAITSSELERLLRMARAELLFEGERLVRGGALLFVTCARREAEARSKAKPHRDGE